MIIAGLMESSSDPLRVHISESTARALMIKNDWRTEHRHEMVLDNGKKLNTYWLLGKK